MTRYKFMLMAGEASGDLHGSNLAKKLLELCPEAEIFGMGGGLMRQAGVELLFDPTQMSTIGFAEALQSYRTLRRVLQDLDKVLAHRRPDVVVLIDFPGFNMRFGQLAKKREIPVVYYFSPAAWAWGRGRARKVAGFATKVASVFPFEHQVYQEAGADVEFVGHPLLDIVQVTKTREELCSQVGLDPRPPIIGLLPGSRVQELKTLFPIMLEAAREIASSIQDAQFLVPIAHTVSEQLLRDSQHSDLELKTLSNETYNVMAACDLAVIACGTATLEAAILGTPLVAIYRISNLTYLIAKRLVKISHFALPNIVMGREIVPELIQADATGHNVAHTVLDLWNHPEKREQMRRDFKKMRAKLGQPGAVNKAAQMVVDVAAQHHRS